MLIIGLIIIAVVIVNTILIRLYNRKNEHREGYVWALEQYFSGKMTIGELSQEIDDIEDKFCHGISDAVNTLVENNYPDVREIK